MKKNVIIVMLGMLMVACGPDARLDMAGMFAGSSPKIDERFNESKQYNDKNGYATLKAPVDNYHVYVCTDTHITNNKKRWQTFIHAYRSDLLCPVAVHLGDLIDASDNYQFLYDSYMEIPKNFIKKDTLMAVAGNHDIYFKQWPQFIKYFKTSSYYFVVETPKGLVDDGEKDLFIVYDSADGTVGKKQLEWLKEILKWSDTQDFRHKVVCTHTHFYRRDNSQGITGNYPLDETYVLMNLFEKHGVDMVWSGHDHSREITYIKGMTFIVVDSMTEKDKEPFYMKVTMGKEIDYEFVPVE